MGSTLTRCAQHGLHYDPSQHAGCVVCRRSSSLPPGGSLPPVSDPGPTPSAQPPAEPVPRAWTWARLALGVFFAGACARAVGNSMGGSVSLTALYAAVLCAAFLALSVLPTVFAVCRSWRVVSWLFLIASFLFCMLVQVGRVATASLLSTGTPLRTVTSKQGTVSIRVPLTWRESMKDQPQFGFEVDSPSGTNIVELEFPTGESAANLSAREFFQTFKERWGERERASFGDTTDEADVLGQPGMKAPFTGTFEGRSRTGVLLATRYRQSFFVVMIMVPPAVPEELPRALSYVHGATIKG